MSKNKPIRSKLSFNIDEEDDDTELISNKTKSNKFKKIKQSPTVLYIEPVEELTNKPTSSTTSSGGEYSKENLMKLKELQNFKKNPIIIEENISQEVSSSSNEIKIENSYDEIIELSGEDAEEFVEFTEKFNYNQLNSNVDNSYLSSIDIETIQQARIINKQLLKGTYNNDRVYTSSLMTNQTTKSQLDIASNNNNNNILIQEDNDMEWEDEIMKRGVINSNVLQEKKIELLSTTSSSKSKNSNDLSKDSNNNQIRINEILKSVNLAIEKITNNNEQIDRKIQQLQSDTTEAHIKENLLRDKVKIGVDELNIVNDLRYFFASIVGMLREKDTLIDELYRVVLKNILEYQETVQNTRIEKQEDAIYRLKEVLINKCIDSNYS